MNPYLRVIYPASDEDHPPGTLLIDVYRILDAYKVESHAVGHAIKKLLAAGKRGDKDYAQDLGEAITSIQAELDAHKRKGGK